MEPAPTGFVEGAPSPDGFEFGALANRRRSADGAASYKDITLCQEGLCPRIPGLALCQVVEDSGHVLPNTFAFLEQVERVAAFSLSIKDVAKERDGNNFPPSRTGSFVNPRFHFRVGTLFVLRVGTVSRSAACSRSIPGLFPS
jgi:hypothetical protein